MGVLLALGAVLRLARPDLVAFKLDEARFLGIVERAASGGWPTAGGMSSWGGFHPPLRAYLLAPTRWVTSDATAAPALLGLFSLLNLGAVALAAMRFGGVAALASVALAAASPWLLHFNRALWDAPLPMFGTLALYAALRTVAQPGSRWAAAVAPLLALQALTHLTAWLALPISLYLVARFKALRSRWFLGGALLGVVLLAPFVIILVTGPEPLGEILSARAESQGRSIRAALTFASWYVSGADLQALLGVTYAPEYRFAPLLALGPFLIGCLLAAGAWAAASRRRQSGPAGDAAEVLLAWVLIPLAITVALPGAAQLHYFQTWGGGAPFILGGLGFAWIYERVRPPLGRAVGLAALLVIPLVQASAWIDLLGYVERFPDTALGPPLGAWQNLADVARGAGAEGRVTVWTEGDQPAYQDKPAALSRLLGSEPAFLKRDSAPLFPEGPTVFISTPPRGDPTWGFEVLPGASLVGASTAGRVWQAGPASSAPRPAAALRAPFVDGLTLEGFDWRVPPGSRELQLVTFWLVDAPTERARRADLTLFVHVEDAAGQRVGQDDGLDWPSAGWTPGTRIAQRSSVDVSRVAGAVSVRVGVYSRKDQQRSPRLDSGEDSVVLGPLNLPIPGD